MSANKENIVPEEGTSAQKAKNIRSILMWSSIALAAVVLGVLLYIFVYREPAIKKGDEAIAQADRVAFFENDDSTALAMYETVAAEHGFNAGNRATLEAAIRHYAKGDYQKALDYVEDYDATDNVVGALAYGLKGDCLVNLDKLDDAVKAFDKAISRSDNNPQLIPYFMTKKAVIFSAQKKFDEAAGIYSEIEEKYPSYAAQNAVESRRVQAESFAGK